MGRYLHKNRAKRNIPIRAAAVLFCLTLLSIYLVTGLFARYATSAESSDDARVARFSIQGEGTLLQGIEANLIPGGSMSLDLEIHNDSEVAVEYTVEVANVTENLPLSFDMIRNGGASAVQQDSGNHIESVVNGNSATFSIQQIPGNHTDSYRLNIDWKKQDGDLALMGMVDYIAVTVTAAQID